MLVAVQLKKCVKNRWRLTGKMPSLPELVKALNVAYQSADYQSCEKLLSPVKVELIKNNLLIPDFQKTDENYINDLDIAKQILEIGALAGIFNLDFESFKNYYAQVRVYYFSGKSEVSESENKYKLISCYLLTLLSEGDITAFHSELEYLGKHIPKLEDDTAISYPIKVEKALMEGSYQKAWEFVESGSKVPEFNVFSETLMFTIREEIARNTELSYDSLPLTNIKALLFLKSEKDAEAFSLDRNWNLANGVVTFNEKEPEEQEKKLPSAEEKFSIINKAYDYAINLEAIV